MTEALPVADGIVEKAPDGSTQVRFVRRLPHPVERVWEALTDPAELRKWWGDADLDLVDGGRFALRWLNSDQEGNVATLDGAITKLDPPRLLGISAAWGSTGSGGPGAATTEGPEPADTRTAAGWHLHLDALAAILAGGEVDLAHPEPAFEPIHRAYTERYGAADD